MHRVVPGERQRAPVGRHALEQPGHRAGGTPAAGLGIRLGRREEPGSTGGVAL